MRKQNLLFRSELKVFEAGYFKGSSINGKFFVIAEVTSPKRPRRRSVYLHKDGLWRKGTSTWRRSETERTGVFETRVEAEAALERVQKHITPAGRKSA